MSQFLRQAAIVARRDFRAVVATPTFLLFLLAPLMMILVAIAGGSGAEGVAKSSAAAARIAIITGPADGAGLKAADARLRKIGAAGGMPELTIIQTNNADERDANALFNVRGTDYFAVMYGDLTRPTILHEATSGRAGLYLAELSEQVLRARKGGVAVDAALVKPQLKSIPAARGGVGGQRATGYMAVVGIFFLTLLLAGQAVGMLAEEKSNKVIEILAAAVPLEAVFLGKLIGMFGVALLFVSFWGSLIAGWLFLTPEGAAAATGLDPAVGIVPFMILCALYFTMSYMLLGAVFLGVGGLASTMREIQMMSLPITVLQFTMFGLASSASGTPGGNMARLAEIIPFSSPMAMGARAATDEALWPHVVAVAWQTTWVAIIIWFGARLFRYGVLKSGGGWRGVFLRRAKVQLD
jgi:ABC-2 type transport system permease protein